MRWMAFDTSAGRRYAWGYKDVDANVTRVTSPAPRDGAYLAAFRGFEGRQLPPELGGYKKRYIIQVGFVWAMPTCTAYEWNPIKAAREAAAAAAAAAAANPARPPSPPPPPLTAPPAPPFPPIVALSISPPPLLPAAPPPPPLAAADAARARLAPAGVTLPSDKPTAELGPAPRGFLPVVVRGNGTTSALSAGGRPNSTAFLPVAPRGPRAAAAAAPAAAMGRVVRAVARLSGRPQQAPPPGLGASNTSAAQLPP
jgi:hypothetical protein